MKTIYRISCIECDCEHDGTDDVSGWTQVERIQSLRESRRPKPVRGDKRYHYPTAWEWETHYGICPDCSKERKP